MSVSESRTAAAEGGMRACACTVVGIWILAAGASAAERIELSKSVEIVAFKSKARIEVKNVTLDFWPKGRVLGDPRKKGRQFVRVELAVTNIGSEPHSLNYTAFELATSEEPRVFQTPYINKGNSADRLGSTQLQAGQSASGALYFEVGRKETQATLALLTRGYERGKGEVRYRIPFSREPASASAEGGATAASRPAVPPAAPPGIPPAGSSAPAAGPVAAASAGADPKAVEVALTQWIGTTKDGWTPVAFAALRSGMSAAEVGQHFPGAEKLIGNMGSKLRISGIPYVQEVQFDFLKSRPDGQKGLDHAILTFERGFFDDKPRFDALVRVLEAKFGPMRPGPNSLTKGFWMVQSQGQQRMAQLTNWGKGQDWQLSFDFPTGAVAPASAQTASRVVSSTSIFHSSSCRAVEAAGDTVIVEASAADRSACNAALKEKLRSARCTSGVASVSYRLQQWGVGRWSNGVRLSLSCR